MTPEAQEERICGSSMSLPWFSLRHLAGKSRVLKRQGEEVVHINLVNLKETLKIFEDGNDIVENESWKKRHEKQREHFVEMWEAG